jgi:type III pantothenate kinase
VASVVPVLDKVFSEMTEKYFHKKAYFVRGQSQKLMKILYDNPKEVGADRIANAAAAFHYYKKSCIIIDFGTATTFDCIGKKGEYIGGVIVPGPHLAAEALNRRTAKLPRVEIKKPKTVIGKTTVASIQSGIYYGYIGLIREILYKIVKEMKGNPFVIATGGLAGLISNDIKEVKKVDSDLTLEGIRILWDKK